MASADQAPSPCALPPLSELSSAELIARHGTGLDAYQLEGGVWLQHAPVLVNREFDFAVAMAMGGMGAGIAAGQRKQGNEATAAALAGVVLTEEARRTLDALRAQGTHVFFVLWGTEEAQLRMVVERGRRCEGAAGELRVVEGARKALRGDGGWDAEGALVGEMAGLLQSPSLTVRSP